MTDKNDETNQEKSFTRLNDLSHRPGSVKSRRRVGRGPGSGLGKTAGRGHKGHQARSGYSRKVGFEGGQMPLQRRLPKRGFNNIHGKQFTEVNVGRLGRFDAGASIGPVELKASGVVSRIAKDGVKLLGLGEVDRALHLKVQGCSEAARKKIEDAGGSVEILAFGPAIKEASA